MSAGRGLRARLAPLSIGLLLLALALSSAPPASAATPAATHHGRHRLAAAPRGFWTPARMRRALRSDSLLHRRLPARAATPGATAAASSLPVLAAAEPEDRTNGRVFAVDPKEGPYSCSGTSLATPSGSIVLTAGHCVMEDGRWGTRLIFVPAYEHGIRPFGVFRASAVFVTTAWEESENSDFDVAALRVEPNAFGTLSEAVGARGWTSGRSRFAPLRIFGYPAAALAGEEMRSCLSDGLGSDALTNPLPGPPTIPARCDMAGGASGGAWLLGRGQLIDGVTSYGYSGQRDRLYSPYFGPAIAHFLSHLP